MEQIEVYFAEASGWVWGTPLLILLMGGGIFFMLYIEFLPFRYLPHAYHILLGKYSHQNAPGDINHYQALSSSLAATIGFGNVSGVAIAIVSGGPGVLFWMWVSAFFGMATKFFTCTLAVMYRGKDTNGHIQGGPMYFITEGLGKKWKFMAVFFCFFCLFGASPLFQANQIVQITNDILKKNTSLEYIGNMYSNFALGIVITILTALVIFGGIKRIGEVAGKMVPFMVLLYLFSVLFIMFSRIEYIPSIFQMILKDAFTAKAAFGGSVLMIIIEGAKRASFSNEAGIGTAPMMHGASKTNEPVREGLVAMLGPVVDTLVICSLTGFAILSTDMWKMADGDGIQITYQVFEAGIPYLGTFLLYITVLIFGFTTLFSYSYYGVKALSYLFGAKYGNYFNYWYVATILVGSVATLSIVVDFINIMFGLMAIPNMIAALLLAPKVKKAAKEYFSRMKM